MRHLYSRNSISNRPVRESFSRRRGFTLVEMLVVIAIVLILAAITIASFNYSTNADRMRAGARQVQSFLGGARDKAIYAKEVRGVRLLLDPNDNHAVNAVQYIGSPQRETGTLTFDATGRNVTRSTGIPWQSLFSRGFLRVGSRIQIPRDTGTWFTVSAINPGTGVLALSRPNTDLAGSSVQVGFVLELAPGVLGDAQPIPLPRGCVIDLDGSNVPSTWRPSTFAGSYSNQMDILFTPRGTVVGDALGLGMLHLHFADASDVVKWKLIGGRSATYYAVQNLPLVPANIPTTTPPPPTVVSRDRILTTLVTRTGNVGVYHVNPANAAQAPALPIEAQLLADDPFLFAETGQVANK